MKNSEKTMEKIVNLCKGRGFIFAGSEIYGGLANTWDYGPLGVELKNNVKKAWWKKFVQENPYNVGLDAAILMNPQVWVASGHVGGFSDPLMDCKECKERFRADKVIEDWCQENSFELGHSVDAMTQAQMKEFVEEHNIPCPTCGKHNWTDIRQFNLMFKTFQGVTEDAKNTVYLRPETAQGIFVNFQNVQRTTRRKLPFGVCQIGKSFRNEITPGNFTFRTREFEQMELEFFCTPGTELDWFAYWKDFCHKWLLNLGMRDENLRLRDHDPEELSHYSNATTDFEFVFPFGWGELWGVASRTNFDLTAHQNTSGKDMTYFDQEKNEHYIPYVGRGQERRAHRPAPPPRSGPLQVRHPAPVQEAGRQGPGDPDRAVQVFHGGLRRRRLHRQALPPPGRDRHPLLHHRGLRDRGRRQDPRGQRRHHPGPGYHGAGTSAHF